MDEISSAKKPVNIYRLLILITFIIRLGVLAPDRYFAFAGVAAAWVRVEHFYLEIAEGSCVHIAC